MEGGDPQPPQQLMGCDQLLLALWALMLQVQAQQQVQQLVQRVH